MCEKWFFMLWEQGVEGSNPFAPTVENQEVTSNRNLLFFANEKKFALDLHVCLAIFCITVQFLHNNTVVIG